MRELFNLRSHLKIYLQAYDFQCEQTKWTFPNQLQRIFIIIFTFTLIIDLFLCFYGFNYLHSRIIALKG